MAGHAWTISELRFVWTISVFVLGYFSRGYECTTICDHGDSESLLEFKAGLIYNGLPFSSWKASTNCCFWTGVNCSSAGRVQGLTVQGLTAQVSTYPPVRPTKDPRYKGVVGETLGNLTALETLQLDYVDLNGNLPASWGHLSKLTTLFLSCNFTGGIPREYGRLTEIVSWSIQNPDWSLDLPSIRQGPLPTELCNLTKLESVSFSNAGLSGELPSCLDRWKMIRVLHLSGNFFQGPVAPSLGNLSLLETLDLSDNRLIGSIPTSFTKLTALQEIVLSYNYGITGSIPVWIGKLKALRRIAVNGNNMTGDIPSSIGQLTQLSVLRLENNYLRGNIPPELGNLTKGSTIHLSYNLLSGPIPPELGRIFNLGLEIDHLNLSGPIPDTFGNLSYISAVGNFLTGNFPLFLLKCSSVSLSSNNLTGSLRQSGFVPEKSNIQVLQLDFNLLDGALPEWLSNFTKLSQINLSRNYLEGVIPTSLFALPNLITLDLSQNHLTSELPSTAPSRNTSALTTLSLNQNHIYGSISDAFCTYFSNLIYLDLSSNNLSGGIPSSLGDSMQGLQEVILSNNNLGGVLPTSLFNLSVSQIEVADNMLVGSIPSLGSRSVLPDGSESILAIDLSNNLLTGPLPENFLNFNALSVLKVGHNYLSGEIPDTFTCSYGLLSSLHLNNNKFRGSLPASLQECSGLEVLDVGWNELSGSLPPWISNFASHLRVFMVGSNNFHGVLPGWLSNFTKLQVIDFSNNSFSGPIPPSFSQLEGLQQIGQALPEGTLYDEHIEIYSKGQLRDYGYVLSATTSLDLSGNEISGDIPAQLGDLKGLLFLNLSRNNLSGSIPSTFAHLAALESLDLSSNKLSGAIPTQMAVDLTFLGYLNVSDNSLSGEIPYRDHFTTFNSSCFAGNPGLCGLPLPVQCLSPTPASPPSSGPRSSHASLLQKWVSFPAFGVGISMSFSLVSSFLLPRAYVEGRKAKAARIVPKREKQYGVFRPRQ